VAPSLHLTVTWHATNLRAPRPPPARIVGAGLALLLAWGAAPSAPRAADPVHYTVTIAATGQPDLDAAVHDASTLVSLRETAPVGPFALVARAQSDAGRFQAALRSFGYYAGSIAITIDQRPMDDSSLPDRLQDLPAATEVPVTVTLTEGPLFHLGRIELKGEIPPEEGAKLDLHPGQPARAADVLTAGAALQQTLRNDGYALARVDPPVAMLDPAADAVDVSFPVRAGPRVDIGAISVNGLGSLHEDYVRRRFEVRPGERYDAARLEQARQDLYDTGLFSNARVTTPDTLDADGRIPVRIDLKERPLHSVKLSAGWSTDQGILAGASWIDRDLFGEAEQVTLSANATGLGGSANRAPGYNLTAQYLIPDWLRRKQDLTFTATAVKEFLEAYDRNAVIGAVTLSRELIEHLTGTVGVVGEQAHISQEGVPHDYTLGQVPVGLKWDNTNSPVDPTRGFRAAATVTPTFSFGNAGTQFFALLVGTASTYIDLSGGGRTVLAMRGRIGSAPGVPVFNIPPDQRFYAGGGGSIRGYRYQSVGPTFPDGRPTGGTGVDDGSVELRQRFGANWGAVGFIDAGQLGNGGPFSGNLRVGAGVGVRYYTSFGPIRFDIAVPLIHQQKSDVVEAYVGLGQAF
jgi:translocation and assembly module TamA